MTTPHSDVARWNHVKVPERVRERAATNWELDGDCWISKYSTGSHGYAQIGWRDAPDQHMVLAHRASWEHANGPVPAGKTLDHICKAKKCVNPAHLRVLDNWENARRTSGRDWPLGQCVNGHPNGRTYRQPAGKRVCRDCKSIWTSRDERNKRLRHS